ncbi:hypothetical protein LOC54_04730 [Acetobacter sp. AN02]|nr:hypothetical protein [Acetobacter sp. AN02]MDG6094424.1 hypothetical protein [Acetobacter sp. AN02]
MTRALPLVQQKVNDSYVAKIVLARRAGQGKKSEQGQDANKRRIAPGRLTIATPQPDTNR